MFTNNGYMLNDNSQAKPATYSLSGKVVLIITSYDQHETPLVLTLAEHGADLALLCSPQTKSGAFKMKQQVTHYENVDCQVFQLREPEQAHEVIHHVAETMGKIDILLDCSRMVSGD